MISGDLCPYRKGSKDNGCPELKISTESTETYFGKYHELKVDFPKLKDDKYLWSCDNCDLVNETSRRVKILPRKVGYIDISIEINGIKDNFFEKKSKTIHAKILKKDLYGYFNRLLGKSNNNIAKEIESFCSFDCTVVDYKTNFPILGDGSLSIFLYTIQSSNIAKMVSYLTPGAYEIDEITYEKNSGKIRQIKISKNK